MFCDDLEEWDGVGGGRLMRKGMYVYIRPIHGVTQQKPAQHCKASILQIKISKNIIFKRSLCFIDGYLLAVSSHDRERKKGEKGDFPGGPVSKTPHSQCRGPGFDPWSQN